mmetsp:Transcript_15567/g.37101  ORF Transcript_15567/g.37101 Transcript_15567/m.37101 type:complete len:124 (-) Transcript_15567:330-701(-)
MDASGCASTLSKPSRSDSRLNAISKRMQGKVGPPPTDEELLQWLADTEAILVQILQGKRPPGSDKVAEDFALRVSTLYMSCAVKCDDRGLDYSIRPKVAEYASATTDAAVRTALLNRVQPRVD